MVEFTPHARGSTPMMCTCSDEVPVYPACAGIDPQGSHELERCLGLPRMRGDRPEHSRDYQRRQEFTPHARGSTFFAFHSRTLYQVYPACAGIDPECQPLGFFVFRLPRMRGDRPEDRHDREYQRAFTPHARGSTPGEAAYWGTVLVYPACAGIDRGWG